MFDSIIYTHKKQVTEKKCIMKIEGMERGKKKKENKKRK